MDKVDKLVEEMNKGGDVSGLLVKAIESLEYYEKEWERFESTEKHRMNLLEENESLKKELGKLIVVKNLMDSAEIYGYQDLLESTLLIGKLGVVKNDK